jgi:hypothetical protein
MINTMLQSPLPLPRSEPQAMAKKVEDSDKSD